MPQRLFGTDGVRGRAGAPPLDPPTVRRLGAALVRALPRAASSEHRLLVGRDTRESGEWIGRELAYGARSQAGCRVTSAGVISTPAIAYLTREGPVRRRASSSPPRTTRSRTTASRCSRARARSSPSGSSARSRRDRGRPVVDGAGRRRPPRCRTRTCRIRTSTTRAPRCRPPRASAGCASRSTAPTARRPTWRRACFAGLRIRRRAARLLARRRGTSTWRAARPIPQPLARSGRLARVPSRHRVRRRRRPRHFRRPSRPHRRRRRDHAAVRQASPGDRPAAQPGDRRDRDEQHRPRDRAARERHRPGAVPGGRQVRDGGDDRARHRPRAASSRATSSSRTSSSRATAW